jgi:hypothetical protein
MFAAMALLLSLCSGPSEMPDATPNVAVITDFTQSPHTFTATCGGQTKGAGGNVIAVFPNLAVRSYFSEGVGSGQVTVGIDNDRFNVTTAAACRWVGPLLVYQTGSPYKNGLNFSAFSKVIVDVETLIGGPVTDCVIAIEDENNNPGITSNTFSLQPGPNRVSIAGGKNMDNMQEISFSLCDFAGPTTLVIEAIRIKS